MKSLSPVDAPNHAAIIGAGLIGCAWAVVFARAQWQVSVYDQDPTALARARDTIAEQLKMLAGVGLCAQPDDVQSRIAYDGNLQTAIKHARYVQECGPEDIVIKKNLFAQLDALASPDAILASSTSGFMTSQFAAGLAGRHRILVAHPVNPPHLVPLVEISPAQWTDEQVTTAAYDMMTALGQIPIRVRKEIPGFILNRLQGALLNEAMHLVEAGNATPDDIDKAVRDGLGLRWSFMGPFETIDLNAPAGLADYAARYGRMYRDMALMRDAPPTWGESTVAQLQRALRAQARSGDIAHWQAWRNRRLAALIVHKKQAEEQLHAEIQG